MEVITVRKCQKLYELINQIASDKEKLYMIHIDNTLIERSKLKKLPSDENYDYEFVQEGYKLIMDAGDDARDNWYFLWQVIKPDGSNLYSLSKPYLLDYLDGKCECKDFYIRKWGSKTKIDEE